VVVAQVVVVGATDLAIDTTLVDCTQTGMAELTTGPVPEDIDATAVTTVGLVMLGTTVITTG
jgi:hypothetical protein